MNIDQEQMALRTREILHRLEEIRQQRMTLENELHDCVQYTYRDEDRSYNFAAIQERAKELRKLSNAALICGISLHQQALKRRIASDELRVLHDVFGKYKVDGPREITHDQLR